MLFLSLSIGGATLFGVFSFSVSQFVVLSVALIISALINQYQLTIPQTKIKLTTKELIVSWGVVWLGVSGGVLLAAGGSIIAYKNAKDKKQWLLDGFINIVSSFAAGNIFYAVLKYLAGFK